MSTSKKIAFNVDDICINNQSLLETLDNKSDKNHTHSSQEIINSLGYKPMNSAGSSNLKYVRIDTVINPTVNVIPFGYTFSNIPLVMIVITTSSGSTSASCVFSGITNSSVTYNNTPSGGGGGKYPSLNATIIAIGPA